MRPAFRSALRSPKPVFVSTDPGGDPDDYWLLAHLAVSPELDVRGVVTNLNIAAGSASSEYTAANARRVFDPAPAVRRPRIVAGAPMPVTTHGVPNRDVHLDGARFLLAASGGFSANERLPVLVTGPATDIALALLLDPTVADRIDVIAMAFEAWPAGGDPWNVRSDVRAWQIVLESAAPVTIGDCRVTARDLAVHRALAFELVAGCGELGRLLYQVYDAWLRDQPAACANATGRADSWPLWDEITLGHLFGFTRTCVHARPALTDALELVHPGPHSESRKTVAWIESCDATALWRHLATRLGEVAAHAVRPGRPLIDSATP